MTVIGHGRVLMRNPAFLLKAVRLQARLSTTNWDNDVNTELIVKYCGAHVSTKSLKGFLTARGNLLYQVDETRLFSE